MKNIKTYTEFINESKNKIMDFSKVSTEHLLTMMNMLGKNYNAKNQDEKNLLHAIQIEYANRSDKVNESMLAFTKTERLAFAKYLFVLEADGLMRHPNGSTIEKISNNKFNVEARVRYGTKQAFTSNPGVDFEFALDLASRTNRKFEAQVNENKDIFEFKTGHDIIKYFDSIKDLKKYRDSDASYDDIHYKIPITIFDRVIGWSTKDIKKLADNLESYEGSIMQQADYIIVLGGS